MDLVDPAMADQAPTRFRSDRLQAAHRIERDYTVTFYVDDIKPCAFPSFPYFVNGSAAGKVRIIAYVSADCPEHAQIRLLDCFPTAYVEGVEPGRVEQVVPTVQGVSLPERRPGWFRRLFTL